MPIFFLNIDKYEKYCIIFYKIKKTFTSDIVNTPFRVFHTFIFQFHNVPSRSVLLVHQLVY